MTGSGNEQREVSAPSPPESAERPPWRPTPGRQPGGVQRSNTDPPRTGRPESATSEFGNPAGLWLG